MVECDLQMKEWDPYIVILFGEKDDIPKEDTLSGVMLNKLD